MGTNQEADCAQLSKQMSSANAGSGSHVSFASTTNGTGGKENSNQRNNFSPPRRATSAPVSTDEDGIENNVDGKKRLDFATNCTFPSCEAGSANRNIPSWSNIEGPMFNVRCGANYQKNKLKAPSLPSLYEVVAVRCFRSTNRTKRVADTLPLPIHQAYPPNTDNTDEEGNVKIGQISNPVIPEILVVHFALPFEEPNMFRPKNEVKGGEVVFYLRPSKRFVEEINGDSPMTPATNLFARWCQTCEKDFEMRSRFKCMALVDDLDKLNLGWVTPYNGKPVLITESGSARRGMQSGVRYLEMTANVHKWGFLAKKSFVSLIPRYKDMNINIGFTIEATNDYEMPECMLGTVCMNNINDSTLLEIPEELQMYDDDAEGTASSSPRKSGLLGSMKKK